MKPFLAVALALLALAGCSNRSDGRSEAQRLPLTTTEVVLTHSNVAEFDGQVAILVKTELVGGNTVVTIPAITSWPIANGFLGLDHFYYAASSSNHPIIQVKDEGCDELVIGGQACGWMVNYDGTIADSFGSFASKKSNSPASHGATTQDLVFVLLGDVPFAANDHGAMFAVHGRFEEDCSGWFSDGTATYVHPDPACIPMAEHTCSLSVDPATLELLTTGAATATVTVEETGVPVVPIDLSIEPLPLPPGLTVGLAPSSVTPPGTSLLTVTALGAPEGPMQLTVVGEGFVDQTGERFECRTTLDLNLLPPPPPPTGGCFCPP